MADPKKQFTKTLKPVIKNSSVVFEKSSKPGIIKKSNKTLYFEAMKKQNDSLRKLPKNDKHHLPTFNSLEEAESFYTPSPENQKLRDIRKLGDKLRKKHLSPMNMKKQYKVKDINNNGKIDGWEQGKYDAINNSATKMGYSMKMGSQENYSPTNFRTKDAMLMAQSPMMMNDPEKKKNNSTTFSVDPDKGARLETKVTTTNKPIQSSQSVQEKSTSNLANYQKGLKNLGPDFKPTKAQTTAANKKVAELKKKDTEAAAYNASIKKSAPKSSSKTEIDKKVNPTTVKQIETESKQKVSKAIGEENFRRYGVEIQAKKDSTAAAEGYIGSKMSFLGRKPEIDERIYKEAGKKGWMAANSTRKKGFVKMVNAANNIGFGPYSRKGGYLIK